MILCYYSLFAIRYSLFAIRYSLFAILAFFITIHSGDAQAQNCPTVTMGTKPEGYIFYNADFGTYQTCLEGRWVGLGRVECPVGDGCDLCHPINSPAPGQECLDGSIYAGLSPDGNVPMFTTPADAGRMYFNNGNTTGLVYSAAANDHNSGAQNTTILVQTDSDTVTPGFQPHQGALYCYCLGKNAAGLCADDPTNAADAHGHDDWYMPAHGELFVLCDSRNDIGGFNLTGDYSHGTYMSSSDADSRSLGLVTFSVCGWGGADAKLGPHMVRCVRKNL